MLSSVSVLEGGELVAQLSVDQLLAWEADLAHTDIVHCVLTLRITADGVWR